MVEWFLAIPQEVRLALLALLGAVVGGQVNRGVYRLAWQARPIGPWSAPHADAPPRRWSDRLPIVGWYGLARESSLWGRGYWIRPLVIEAALAAAFAGAYHWLSVGGLLPDRPLALPADHIAVLHQQYVALMALLSLMTIATFIDFDEKTIPDEITMPGVWLALLLAAVWPGSQLPVADARGGALLPGVEPLQLCSPYAWQGWLAGVSGLAIGVGCYLAWLTALLPYTWTTRRGLVKAVRYFFASLVRRRGRLAIAGVAAVCGVAWIAGGWTLGGARWVALLSSLVGLAVGGGTVWAVRLVGRLALGREAMGFGDVTLLAMIGAFVGWQPALLIFFLAPVTGLAVAVAQAIATGRTELAFGPYLCLATVVLVACWPRVWHGWAEDVFQLGSFIPIVLLVCLVLMGVLLVLIRGVREKLFGPVG